MKATNVTDAVLRVLRGLTSLSKLFLIGCTLVTDGGVRALSERPAFTHPSLLGADKVTAAGA